MGKLKNAALVGTIAFQNALLNSTTDPMIKSILVFSSFAFLIPYAIFSELYKKEAEEILLDLLKSGKITEEVIKSPEFQQSLGNLFDNLKKMKESEKRDLNKRAFMGAYISEDEYTKNYLERIQDVSMRISVRAIQHLSFVKKEVLPLLKKEAESFMNNPQAGYTPDGFKTHKMRTIAISQFYDEYYSNRRREVEREFNRNTNDETRRAFDLVGAEEQKTRLRFVEFWTEFNTLGIFRQGNDPTIGTVGGGSGTVQYLTEFGNEFIKYISTESMSASDYIYP